MVEADKEQRQVAELRERIWDAADRICQTADRPLTIMEVCGTHTMSIARYGLKALLPEKIRLISGPGCPVCVTDAAVISAALALAELPGVSVAAFGDMLRVPAGDASLMLRREQGWDVRLVTSPLEALQIAESEPDRQVVFLAVGFETTAPLTAATVALAAQKRLTNFSIIPAHKTMPAAIRTLLGGDSRVDALLCPGHVAAVTGPEEFAFVGQELGLPAVVCGFAPAEILEAVWAICEMAAKGETKVRNCYRRAVKPGGNPTARALLQQVFAPCDAVWRGLGMIESSGLALRDTYADFNAYVRFEQELAAAPSFHDDPACCCGQVLQGRLEPSVCPLFGTDCTPRHPRGACMVSSEGSCAAAYKYREVH